MVDIREYEQVVYIYWLGRELGTVKIGHTNNPDRRLSEFKKETGTPGHKAGFAALVWLDRGRKKVEAAVHAQLASLRRDGEWFELTAEQALAEVVAVVERMGIRYEVEDRAGVSGGEPVKVDPVKSRVVVPVTYRGVQELAVWVARYAGPVFVKDLLKDMGHTHISNVSDVDLPVLAARLFALGDQVRVIYPQHLRDLRP